MQRRIACLTAVLLVAATARADVLVIHNGLAPPNPANVISGEFPNDEIYVQNVGCDVRVQSPCASPGAPTRVAMVDGGYTQSLTVTESSRVEMSGGFLGGGFLVARDAATITLSGGFVAGSVVARGSSQATLSGGIANGVEAYDASRITVRGGSPGGGGFSALDASLITIVGSDFVADPCWPLSSCRAPLSYGVLPFSSGWLTGTLASGETLAAPFVHDSLQVTGLITLIPEPGAGILLGAGLTGLAARRRSGA